MREAEERGLIKTSMGYMHYRASGSGTAVVLLHGNAKSSVMFLELMEALPGDVRSIAIDLPGCGNSDHVDGALRTTDYARVVLELLRGLGVSRACVLGQAAGARIATEMANTAPDVVERVILVNCPYYANRDVEVGGRSSRDAIVRPTDENGIILTRTLAEYVRLDPGHSPMNPPQSWAERRNLVSLQAGRDGLQMRESSLELGENLMMSLARLECPVMNMWGEHFGYTKHKEEFEKVAKNHKTVVLEGTRFDPWVDDAAAVSREIIAFLG